MPTPEEWVVIVISIIVAVALLVYFGVLIWAKQNKRWVFAPYDPPDLPNGYKINGQVKELTPDEQENRRKLIEAAIRRNKGISDVNETKSIVSVIDLLSTNVSS